MPASVVMELAIPLPQAREIPQYSPPSMLPARRLLRFVHCNPRDACWLCPATDGTTRSQLTRLSLVWKPRRCGVGVQRTLLRGRCVWGVLQSRVMAVGTALTASLLWSHRMCVDEQPQTTRLQYKCSAFVAKPAAVWCACLPMLLLGCRCVCVCVCLCVCVCVCAFVYVCLCVCLCCCNGWCV